MLHKQIETEVTGHVSSVPINGVKSLTLVKIPLKQRPAL